jgi:hypothetical protein
MSSKLGVLASFVPRAMIVPGHLTVMLVMRIRGNARS